MHSNEYESHDGLALARLLDQGEVTPAELLECAITLAQTRGAELNAICYERYDESRALARDWQPRGVFRGLPFLLKDSGLASRRFPSSIGSRLFNDTQYSVDATLTERFDAAGFLPFARSTVPELCMAPTTEALRNGGPTLNPRNRERSAGGSSGGAAAAVAAGIVPIAHGSDGGGSIRIPAACCGVYGLKPTRGRVPMGPLRGEGWGGLAADGVISRSVRDTAAAMDAISGYQPGNPYAAPPKDGSYLDALAQPFDRPLRIAVWRSAFDDIEIDPISLAAVEHAAGLCRDLGHEIIDAAPPQVDYAGFVGAHATILAANIVLATDTKLGALGRALRDDDLEPALRDGYELGKTLSAARYVDSINRFHAMGRALESAFDGVDLILTPALTRLPERLGELMLVGTLMDYRRKISRYATFLAAINASGQPAATLPLSWTDDNVPVATQIIGRFGREDLVLRLSAQLEAAAPWAARKTIFG